MRILFVHEVNYLEKPVFEMHEFPELLASHGHTVTFMDYAESPKVFPRTLQTMDRMINGRVISDAFLRLVTQPQLAPGVIGRIIAAVLFPLSYMKVVKRFRPEIIVCYGVPTNGWQTVLISKFFQIPVIYRAIDSSTDIRPSKLKTLIAVAEQVVCRYATLVVANNLILSKHCQKLGATRAIVIAPGFSHYGHYSPRNVAPEADYVFMGTLFPFCGLVELVESIAARQDTRHLQFLIVGDGPDRRRLEAKIAELGLQEQFTFTGYTPFESVFNAISRARMGIVPFLRCRAADLALPAKVFQYLLAERPVVSTPLEGLTSTVPPGCGVIFAAPGQPFVDELLQLAEDSKRCQEASLAAVRLLNEKFNWTTQIRAFEDALAHAQIAHKQ